MTTRGGALPRLLEVFDPLLKRHAKRLISRVILLSAALRKCDQHAREAFSVVEARRPIFVAAENEIMLPVDDPM
jgi:hypothetical protein